MARSTGTLFAGNICNTNIYDPTDPKSHKTVRAMFEEQVGWAGEAGVDFVIGETFSYAAEALLALEVIKAAKKPAVITLAMHQEDVTREGWSVVDAARRLEAAGADVVGLNCIRGPRTMMPLLKRMRKAIKCQMAALPVPYRTSRSQPSFQSLRDAQCDCIPGDRPFPTALDPFACNRYELGEFAKEAYELGIHYLGVCCGAGPHHIRGVAEALGRQPPASRYSPDMSKHAFLGTHKLVAKVNRSYAKRL